VTKSRRANFIARQLSDIDISGFSGVFLRPRKSNLGHGLLNRHRFRHGVATQWILTLNYIFNCDEFLFAQSTEIRYVLFPDYVGQAGPRVLQIRRPIFVASDG
jgi:hypothetical protein